MKKLQKLAEGDRTQLPVRVARAVLAWAVALAHASILAGKRVQTSGEVRPTMSYGTGTHDGQGGGSNMRNRSRSSFCFVVPIAALLLGVVATVGTATPATAKTPKPSKHVKAAHASVIGGAVTVSAASVVKTIKVGKHRTIVSSDGITQTQQGGSASADPTCTDIFSNPAGGSYATPSNWSKGLPSMTDYVCQSLLP